MHLIFLSQTLYGSEVTKLISRLRADAAVEFAEVDARRYPHDVPAGLLFQAERPTRDNGSC